MRITNEVSSSFVRMRASRTIDLISEIETLPGILDTPMRILALKRNPNTSARDFADVLSRDASLAAKVLAMANSTWYAPTQPVTRLSHAVAMIGMSNLYTLVFGLSLSSLYPRLSIPQSEVDQFWRVSILKSIAARRLALDICPDKAEDVGLLALLQDIALPVMYAADVSIWSETKMLLDGPAVIGREEKLYGHGHASFGEMIAKKLGLPEVIQRAITAHHDCDALTRLLEDRAQARCLTFAAALPHTVGLFRAREPSAYAASLFDGTPSLDDEARAFDTLRDISNQFRDIVSTIGKPGEGTGSFKELMQEVAIEVVQCVMRTVGQNQAAAIALEKQQAQSTERLKQSDSELDPQTRLYTSDSFAVRAERLFELLRLSKSGACVGVISALDSTESKASQELIQNVAGVLAQELAGKGFAGRISPSEFAFVARVEPNLIHDLRVRILGRFENKKSIHVSIAWLATLADNLNTSQAIALARSASAGALAA